ncbi:MAG: hypothetical protein ACLFPL_04245 [Candidatus Nanoarchaeia archaeon]
METDKSILSKLESIESQLDYIKKNMVEKDEVMTNEEFRAYERSFNPENLDSFDDVKKQLNL